MAGSRKAAANRAACYTDDLMDRTSVRGRPVPSGLSTTSLLLLLNPSERDVAYMLVAIRLPSK